MAKSLRLLLFRGPGEVDQLRAAIIGRQWTILANCSAGELAESWPALEDLWRKRRVDQFSLDNSGELHDSAGDETRGDMQRSGPDWTARTSIDERRPGRRSLLVQTAQALIGIAPGSQMDEPPTGTARTLILDASWTHVAQFPEREEIRQAFAEAFERSVRMVHYVTNLTWDAELFEQVAMDQGCPERARVCLVDGAGERLLKAARRILPEVHGNDTALIGLVPGRDDRGAFQRLRSDFAEKASQVHAFPASPISSGPGASREESLAAVGLWLPTTVLIGGGPISEQHLLARHLQESTGGSAAIVGVPGGEYHVPGLDLIRRVDGAHRVATGRHRLRASFAGLVVVSYGAGDTVTLAGAGLATAVREVLPKIRVNRKGKSPEQVVREVEGAFSSRGMAVPTVRYLP